VDQPGGHTLIFIILIYLYILHKTLTDFEFIRLQTWVYLVYLWSVVQNTSYVHLTKMDILPLHRLQIRFSLILLRQRPTSIGSLWLEVLNLTSKNISLSSNTWAFPYWPGYHPETPILARDGVEVQYG
jgi:hypothetical protein